MRHLSQVSVDTIDTIKRIWEVFCETSGFDNLEPPYSHLVQDHARKHIADRVQNDGTGGVEVVVYKDFRNPISNR